MVESVCAMGDGGEHPERLVQLEPHGHWRRIPENPVCSCTAVLAGCLCCSVTRATPELIGQEEPPVPDDAYIEPTVPDPRESSPMSARRAAPRFREVQTATESPENQQEDALVPAKQDAGSSDPCGGWFICSWAKRDARQTAVDEQDKASPSVERAPETAPVEQESSSSKRREAAQKQTEQAASAAREEPKSPGEHPAKQAPRPQEATVTVAPKPLATRSRGVPYMTKEEAESKGLKIVWYDPEDEYNPLYFGVSPDDIEEQSQLERRSDVHKYLDPALILQYTGLTLGAIVGAGAVGVGFVAAAAGLTVGCTVREFAPYWDRFQSKMKSVVFSHGWD
ncbi:hypothetical protein BESB_025790 [Besnoitia besnoiti]|uniref:Uncharacterized protein n=1 Tax=Besnoitia besnoiti TaxID=94643 RepID=A0A2A9M0V0_BESBE|nr:uncharacterized protein BESB_025790 [Besnoitia besnoiti]PFH31605.1 hypothetical protein BESB_025790 [Besnoitia besnoiti]